MSFLKTSLGLKEFKIFPFKPTKCKRFENKMIREDIHEKSWSGSKMFNFELKEWLTSKKVKGLIFIELKKNERSFQKV